MVLAGRRKSIAFFIALGAGLISVILLLYVGWVLLNWRSGILLFLGLFEFLLLLDLSLASERGFAQVGEWLRYPLVKVLVISSIWALLHHMCAGIRHLFLDVDVGTSLHAARRSAFAVFVASLALTASIAVRIW